MSTPELSAGAQCLKFYYHASGEGQKEITLNVLYFGSRNKLLWTHSGDAGDKWNKVQLEIPQENSNYKVCITISHSKMRISPDSSFIHCGSVRKAPVYQWGTETILVQNKT